MRLRARLIVGERFFSAEHPIEGTIVAAWPVEGGSEILIGTRDGGALRKVFVRSLPSGDDGAPVAVRAVRG